MSSDHDQILASVFTEPIEVGVSRFILRADPPVISKIPLDDLRLTVVMVTAYYQGSAPAEQKFIQIGYYVMNEVADDLFAAGDSPDPSCVHREISPNEDPTVHRSIIKWE
jgi:hypothetical protein